MAITILAALATMTTQMITGATRVTSGRSQRLDSDAQGRTILHCLGTDLRQTLEPQRRLSLHQAGWALGRHRSQRRV